MRKSKSTEEVIQHKKKAIRKLNQLLEDYISSGIRILSKKSIYYPIGLKNMLHIFSMKKLLIINA